MLHPSLLVLAMIAPLGDPPTAADIVAALESATIDAIARAQPSVVAIARVRGDDPEKTTAIRGEPRAAAPLAGPDNKPLQHLPYAAPGDFSSGVVIGADGEILTTYHTLRGSQQIWVRTADKQEFEAEILAADPRSDLAVIAPREGTAGLPRKLSPMKLGDASRMRPGTFLLALGNPYNAARDGKASAGWGILANNARRIHTPPPTSENTGGGVRAQFFRYQPTLLQLDAKLNLGMSGGAVVNMKDELVGLTTAAASPVAYDVQAGYAIPMDRLGRRIADRLRQGKEVEYGFLGIGLSDTVPNAVSSVGRGTPAENAGLQKDDEILAVGDRALDDEDGLTMALAEVEVGQDVKLKVRRGTEIIEITAFVSKYPVNYGHGDRHQPPQALARAEGRLRERRQERQRVRLHPDERDVSGRGRRRRRRDRRADRPRRPEEGRHHHPRRRPARPQPGRLRQGRRRQGGQERDPDHQLDDGPPPQRDRREMSGMP